MGLRSSIRARVRAALDRLSGEYSAGTTALHPDATPTGSQPEQQDVRVVRARLKRPRGEESPPPSE